MEDFERFDDFFFLIFISEVLKKRDNERNLDISKKKKFEDTKVKLE